MCLPGLDNPLLMLLTYPQHRIGAGLGEAIVSDLGARYQGTWSVSQWGVSLLDLKDRENALAQEQSQDQSLLR